MEVETALAITDSLVFAKTGKHLNTLQTEIFRGAWLGQKPHLSLNIFLAQVFLRKK